MSSRGPVSLLRNRLRDLLAPRPVESDPPGPAAQGSSSLWSDEHERRLREEGWTVVDLLDPAACDELLAVWRRHHPEATSTWESDFYSKDTPTKRLIHDEITERIGPALDRHLRDHEILLGVFVTNWPGPGGGLTLHHHSTVVDPAESGSVVVWCALSETTEDNGTLHVVPRSHLLQQGIRPERTPSWHEEHTDRLLSSHLVPVPLAPGQALVFDNQLLHCSFENVTGSPRIAAASIVVPRAATARYHELDDDGNVAAYALDSGFFIDNDPGSLVWARPTGLELLSTSPWRPTTVTVEQLEAVLEPGSCPHPPIAGQEPTVELRPIGQTISGVTAPPVVADPDRQRALEEFGFTVLPALGPDLLEAVRAAASSTGVAPDDPMRALNWSFHSHDDEHKHRVSDVLRSRIWPAIADRFSRQSPFLCTFITKWPGPDSGFAPHQDPTLVDERTAVGVTVWIPLHDVDLDNGMLWVVPGSHRFPGGFRVADVDQFPFADCEHDIIDELGAGIPMRAGEILVFDNRVIHYSLPNRSTAPRVVASFGLRPEDGPSTLARRSGDVIDVHVLPEDFFIEVEPSEQHAWQPTEPPLFSATADDRRWGRTEFAALCRTVPRPPGTVRPSADQPSWSEPAAFCALCGSTEGLSAADRRERNNAQLVCPSCAASGATGPD